MLTTSALKFLKNQGLVLAQVILLIAILLVQAIKYYVPDLYILFWMFYIPFIIVTALGIIWSPHKIRLIFGVIALLVLMPMVNYPQVFHIGRDSSFEVHYASTLIENQHWDPTVGTGFAENYYGYNPAFHIILAHLSLATGADIFAVAKYLYAPFLLVFFCAAVYIFLTEIFKDENEDVKILALLLFILSPSMLLGVLTRRMIAAISMIVLLISLLKMNRSKEDIRWFLIFLLSGFVTVISDHSTSWLMMAFLLGLIVFKHLAKRFEIRLKPWFFPNLSYKILYLVIMLLTWEVYVATKLFQEDFGYLGWVFGIILRIFASVFSPGDATVSATYIHSYIETGLAFASQVLLISLAVLGTIAFVKKIKQRIRVFQDNIFMLYFSVIGVTLFISVALLKRTAATVVANTYFWLPAIAVSILASYFLHTAIIWRFSGYNKYVLYVVLVVIIQVGALFIIFHPVVFNRNPYYTEVADYMESKNNNEYMAAEWLASVAREGQIVAGDYHVFEIFGGNLGLQVSRPWHGQKFYMYNREELDEWTRYNHYNLSYFVANTILMKYPSSLTYGIVNKSRFDDFDKITYWNRIYDNGQMIIYEFV